MAIYEEMALETTEDVEKYAPGGLHPVMINQLLGGGRYHILHKLDSGGLATVWLARDLQYDAQKSTIGPLVSLKIQRADESPKNPEESSEVLIPKRLANVKPELRSQLVLPEHAFMEWGPNGTHLCVAFELAGSNLIALTRCPGRTTGSRRLRGVVARKVSGQVANFVYEMHSAGFVHGGMRHQDMLVIILLGYGHRSQVQ
jgi:serine/threonine-protein kinase SRPK3